MKKAILKVNEKEEYVQIPEEFVDDSIDTPIVVNGYTFAPEDKEFVVTREDAPKIRYKNYFNNVLEIPLTKVSYTQLVTESQVGDMEDVDPNNIITMEDVAALTKLPVDFLNDLDIDIMSVVAAILNISFADVVCDTRVLYLEDGKTVSYSLKSETKTDEYEMTYDPTEDEMTYDPTEDVNDEECAPMVPKKLNPVGDLTYAHQNPFMTSCYTTAPSQDIFSFADAHALNGPIPYVGHSSKNDPGAFLKQLEEQMKKQVEYQKKKEEDLTLETLDLPVEEAIKHPVVKDILECVWKEAEKRSILLGKKDILSLVSTKIKEAKKEGIFQSIIITDTEIVDDLVEQDKYCSVEFEGNVMKVECPSSDFISENGSKILKHADDSGVMCVFTVRK